MSTAADRIFRIFCIGRVLRVFPALTAYKSTARTRRNCTREAGAGFEKVGFFNYIISLRAGALPQSINATAAFFTANYSHPCPGESTNVCRRHVPLLTEEQ
jgi:hypothetical protein